MAAASTYPYPVPPGLGDGFARAGDAARGEAPSREDDAVPASALFDNLGILDHSGHARHVDALADVAVRRGENKRWCYGSDGMPAREAKASHG